MRRARKPPASDDDEMRAEYDFTGGVRGKHAKSYPPDAIAVVLAPDVARRFRDSTSVNRALRALLVIAATPSFPALLGIVAALRKTKGQKRRRLTSSSRSRR